MRTIEGMAFGMIPSIEDPDFYLSTAFGRARNVDEREWKDKELAKIEAVKDDLVGRFEKLFKQFPHLDEMDDFFKELAKIQLEVDKIKKSLGAVLWLIQRVKFFHKQYSQKIKKEESEAKVQGLRREFYGRISSLVKQLSKDFEVLKEARKKLIEFPQIKTQMRTICIVGFPNVGKTTLLSKITGSKGNIQPYAFTTQGLNLGYFENVQFIDTPGTLNRDKVNNVEKVSELAMGYLADGFIFVFDGTEASATIDDQKKFYKRVLRFKKPVHVYVSKEDILKVDIGMKSLSVEELKKVFV